ncbi:hypothetical protein ACY0L3_002621 [Klebsiella oxytoca]|nr:hypothetical protein [Klebsiella oxytoca]
MSVKKLLLILFFIPVYTFGSNEYGIRSIVRNSTGSNYLPYEYEGNYFMVSLPFAELYTKSSSNNWVKETIIQSRTLNLMASCTINDQLYTSDIIIKGLRWQLSLHTDINSLSLDDSQSRNPVTLNMKAYSTGVTTENRGTEYRISCTFPINHLTLLDNNESEIANPGILHFQTTIIPSYRRSVTIPVQPSPIRGAPNFEHDVSFRVVIQDSAGGTSQIKWSVASPCAEWQPVLSLPSGIQLNPNTDIAEGIRNDSYNMIAKFTPTSVGEFSCTGTITVTKE